MPLLTALQDKAADLGRLGKDWCVVAGPGSGKTTVLIEFFRRLVDERNISPLEILAITFTEKAAANIKRRLAEAFEDRPEMRPLIERAPASTFDAFCARLLRENAVEAGVDPQFRVVEEREGGMLRDQAIRDALDQLFSEREEDAVRLMRGLTAKDLAGAIAGIHDAIRTSGMRVDAVPPPVYDSAPLDALFAALEELVAANPAGRTADQATALGEYKGWARGVLGPRRDAPPLDHLRALASLQKQRQKLKANSPERALTGVIQDDLVPAAKSALITGHYARERAVLLDALLRFDRIFSARKLAAGVLDFGDLQEAVARLLESHSSIRERLRRQFACILMDEFQDTNRQQQKILELIRPPDAFYAVGDINQSIYGFRHADLDVFREYRDEVRSGGKNYAELRENFRSRPEILRAAELLFKGKNGIEPHELIPGKTFEPLVEPAVEIAVAIGGEDAEEIEARAIAARIVEMGAPLGDVAVLARNSQSFEALSKALMAAGIPHVVTGGRGFFEAREVLDLTHLARVISNPRDEIGAACVLRSPLVGVSEEALLRLKTMGAVRNLGAAVRTETPGCDPADAERLEAFRVRLAQWRQARDYTPADRLLARALDECGYEPDAGGRVAVEKFLAIARTLARRTLAEFVEDVDRLRQQDTREPDGAVGDAPDAVRVMTVHAAKGLEFPIVFAAAMHKGVRTDNWPLSFSPGGGLGARWANPIDRTDEIGDTVYEATGNAREEREKEEANRLLYVAATRAEQRLVLSFAVEGKSARGWGKLVCDTFGIGVSSPSGPQIRTFASPRGEAFQARISVFASAPPQARFAPQLAAQTAGPEAVDAPALTPRRDSSASVTSLALFAECPRRYYLARYIGCEPRRRGRMEMGGGPPEPRESNASEFGREVHAVLADSRAPAGGAARRLAANFLESPLGERVRRARRVEREFDFLFAMDDLVLRGQIDLWFEDAGGVTLVDYKTDEPRRGVQMEEHAASYALQLQLYAHAVERVAGRAPREAWVYLLRPNLAVPVDVSPLALYGASGVVRELLEAQETARFPMNVREHCARCPFYHRQCPAKAAASR